MTDKPKIILREKFFDKIGAIQELVIWSVPKSVKNPDGVKYRKELPYTYLGVEQLIEDFKKDIMEVNRHENIGD